jgi:hypothetical protein
VAKEGSFPLFIHTLYLAGYNCIPCSKEDDARPRLDYSEVAVSGSMFIKYVGLRPVVREPIASLDPSVNEPWNVS